MDRGHARGYPPRRSFRLGSARRAARVLRRAEGEDRRPAAATDRSAALPGAVRGRDGAVAGRRSTRIPTTPPAEVEHATLTRSRTRSSAPSTRSTRAGRAEARATASTTSAAGICTPEQFTPLPLSMPGADNDLDELFDRPDARRHGLRFGEPWGLTAPRSGLRLRARPRHPRRPPEPGQRAPVPPRRRRLAGRRADRPTPRHRARRALLLRFQSQSWRTDDAHGHAR